MIYLSTSFTPGEHAAELAVRVQHMGPSCRGITSRCWPCTGNTTIIQGSHPQWWTQVSNREKKVFITHDGCLFYHCLSGNSLQQNLHMWCLKTFALDFMIFIWHLYWINSFMLQEYNNPGKGGGGLGSGRWGLADGLWDVPPPVTEEELCGWKEKEEQENSRIHGCWHGCRRQTAGTAQRLERLRKVYTVMFKSVSP